MTLSVDMLKRIVANACSPELVNRNFDAVKQALDYLNDKDGTGHHAIGKLDGALSQGGSATVSVWTGVAGSETDSGENITAYDWLMKSGATAISSGKKVHCIKVNGYWYVVNAECE